jgi:eukaryotic-like serine/threonine-protein kinase
MSLAAGARLGPYEILGAIGAGGQGEVYKAKDTRLDRTVAIKVLPGHLAESPERRERFEREAKTISQLNHPHICTLHDVGRHDGIDFIVLEHIEGGTLAERLNKDVLTFEKSLEYGTEIANALAAAHRAGIVHRDLKPANVMLTRSGVKVLDFGLAKHTYTGPASDDSNLPTRQHDLTKERHVVGTLRYMAPEQLVAEPVDSRTDIWALGVVLYEMLTGVRPFEGESQSALVGAILKDDPRPLVPQPAKRVVEKCLRKDRDDRWQTARDLEDELRWIAGGGVKSADDSAKPRSWRFVQLAVGTTIGAVAAIGMWGFVGPTSMEAPAVKRFTIELPEGKRLPPAEWNRIAVSPDGRNIVYPVLEDDGRSQLYLRPIGEIEPRALAGTEGARNPFFSHDGQWIAFEADGKLLKTSVQPGAIPSAICDVLNMYGASWEPDGTIFFSDTSKLYRVASSGGVPAPIGDGAAPNTFRLFGDVLPGGKAVLFTDAEGPGNEPVSMLSIETLEKKTLIEGGTHPRYVSTGHILFASADAIMAAPFDPKRLAVTGPALPVIRDLKTWELGAGPRFDVSDHGTLVYIPLTSGTEGASLSVVDRGGAVVPVRSHLAPDIYLHPRFSPDGGRVALSRGFADIWVIDLHRDTMERLTFGEGKNFRPVWSHDGKRIYFNSNRESDVDRIFWLAADGSGAVEVLSRAGTNTAPTAASSDGTVLLFQQLNEKKNYDIGVLPLQSEGEPQVLLGTPFNELGGVLSPDDRWVAYVSDESGRSEVYVRPFRGSGERFLASTSGGVEPMWSRDGGELFYRNGYKLMAIPVSPEPGLTLGPATTVFERPFRTGTASAQYDVAPDGSFVLVVVASSSRLHVVLDWFEELKRLVPTEE